MKTYNEIRPSIKSGDIIAWTHKGWGTLYDLQVQIVRFATQSEYCHVGVAWVVGGRVFVIEAVTPKVRIFPLSRLLPFYLVPMPEVWSPQAEEFALAQVGKKYSVMQAVESVFKIPKADNLWQCAELAGAITRLSGYNVAQKATPSALIESALEFSSGLVLVNP